jgi:hypothetical protein
MRYSNNVVASMVTILKIGCAPKPNCASNRKRARHKFLSLFLLSVSNSGGAARTPEIERSGRKRRREKAGMKPVPGIFRNE